MLIDVPTAKYFSSLYLSLIKKYTTKNSQNTILSPRGVQNLHTAFLPGETLGQRLRRIRSLSIVCSRERERERERKFYYIVCKDHQRKTHIHYFTERERESCSEQKRYFNDRSKS